MSLTLFCSFPSPFVRKVLVCADEAQVSIPIERKLAVVSPIKRDPVVAAANPLGKVPTLVLEDGFALFDSAVICEYLNSRGNGSLLPDAGPQRWRVLRDQALADGMLDAAIIARHETASRPAAYQWDGAIAAQREKIVASLNVIETESPDYDGRVDVGTIAVACGLGYLDVRLPDLRWREGRPNALRWYARFAQRRSMLDTSAEQPGAIR